MIYPLREKIAKGFTYNHTTGRVDVRPDLMLGHLLFVLIFASGYSLAHLKI